MLPRGWESAAREFNEGLKSVCRLIAERDSKGDVCVLGREKVLGEEKLLPAPPNLGADGDEGRGSIVDLSRDSPNEWSTACP